MTEYQAGQVWRYKARVGEEASLICIAKIDEVQEMKIYHLFVAGLVLKNPLVEGGVQKILQHLPVSKESLDASVTTLAATLPELPDISEGYNDWKRAFDAGESGAFGVPVAAIIEHIEKIVSKRKPA